MASLLKEYERSDKLKETLEDLEVMSIREIEDTTNNFK